MELNEEQQEELRGEIDTDMPQPYDKKDATEDKSFINGENRVSLTNGNFSVEIHGTNTTLEQVANLSLRLFKQMKDGKETKLREAYLG